MLRAHRRIATLLSVALLATEARAVTFQPLEGSVSALSADGSIAVGSVRVPGESLRQASFWSASTGTIVLDPVFHPGGSIAWTISADGSVVAGESISEADGMFVAYRWTAATGTRALEVPVDGTVVGSSVGGLSADGSVAVGAALWQPTGSEAWVGEAVRWEADGGVTRLGHLDAAWPYSSASGVSADGSVVIGRSLTSLGEEAFRWTSADGMVGLGFLSDSPGAHAPSSVASAVSSDGSIVVGASRNDAGVVEATLWTEAGILALGFSDPIFDPTPQGGGSIAHAISADGSVVVGSSGGRASIWDAEHGMRDLMTLLEGAYGIDLQGWTLTHASSVSADGRTVAGGAWDAELEYHGWIVYLPEPPIHALAALVALALLVIRSRAFALLLASLGLAACEPAQLEVVIRSGFQEPHTPGSNAVEEMPASANVERITGFSPDLNRVTTLRVRAWGEAGAAPRRILILVPGFLGGAETFAPLAQQLVTELAGDLEVWAVDRRPNQLEDRRGARWIAQAPLHLVDERLPQGLQFYFAESPTVDIDQDGVVDPLYTLPDATGGLSSYVKLAQDDLRFAAYWGLDTYLRDWRILVDEARARVGPNGVVAFGGHSMGTSFATAFAAYDFDPGASVDAGYTHVDGLLLLEGGGLGPGATTKPTLSEYQAQVAALAAPGGPDVYLASFSGIPLQDLGPAGEVAGLAAWFRPADASLVQRTNLFSAGLLALLFQHPVDNQTALGLFIDDDFSPVGAFRASIGFSDNGPNALQSLGVTTYYVAGAPQSGPRRSWKRHDDPTLPSCPPNLVGAGVGCALLDNGPQLAVPLIWGVEREVTDIQTLARLQFGHTNGVEWYYVSGRINLDFQYGRDSSVLGDESLLALTQNPAVNVPVLGIGGSNGLTPVPSSFDSYFASIATPPADRVALILEGYAHLDVIEAEPNDAVAPIVAWLDELLARALAP